MDCPACAAVVPDHSRFCGQCGAALPIRCRECAHSNPPASKFCGNCGAKLTTAAAASPAKPAPSEPVAASAAERRLLTVMFCDVVGSTALSARLDPEDLREVIGGCCAAVAEVVTRFGGFVARYMGDGLLVYFGYPQAHEHDAARSVRAGLAVIEAVRARRTPLAEVLQLRVGIATGLVVVGDLIGEGAAQEQAVVGETPNLAARLQGLAAPDTVAIDAATQRSVSGVFDLKDLGAVTLRGFDAPVQAWQPLRASSVESRIANLRAVRTPLFGREEEIDLLLRRWRQAQAGEGRVIILSGEPGIGKSRIVTALKERIAEEPSLRLHYFCSAHHQESALYPITSQIENAARFEPDDAAPAKLAKLETLLARSSTAPERDVALFAELLGIDGGARFPRLPLNPEQRMEQMLAALLAQVVGLAAQSPCLLLFEDAHWIDPTSHELLQRVIERVQELPILLIVTTRPEFHPAWAALPHVTLHPLNRLGRRERMAMIDHLTRGKPLPEEIVRHIIERTDGVPLFVEELTQTIVESGLLREGADRYVLYGPLPQMAIPATLQASLLARLDRLTSAREVAQEAAAIGREFSFALLAAVSARGESELLRALEQLAAAGLILQRGAPPHSTYAFRHALMQDTAYSTLLRGRRQLLHGRIVEALERLFPDAAQTQPELLAHHVAQTGAAEKAIGYWLTAARLAMARGTIAEAVAQLRRALGLVSELPVAVSEPLELELQIALGGALTAARGYSRPETDEAFTRARELSTRLGDMPQLLRITWGQFTSRFAGGRIKAALTTAQDLLEMAGELDDPGARVMGGAAVGTSLLHLASLIPADAAFAAALALDPAGDRERAFHYGQSGRVTALAYHSLCLLLLGKPEAARRSSDQAVAEAAALGHPTSLCFAHSVASRVHFLRRDRRRLATHATTVARLASEQGLGLWQALGSIYCGWTELESGRIEAAIGLMEDGLDRYRAAGSQLSLPLYLTTLADAKARAGQPDAALELLAAATRASAAEEERWVDAEIGRLTAEILLAEPRRGTAAAERHLAAALATARAQGAQLWELRAAASLARLHGDRGQESEARALLRPVLAGFTEGRDTADLQGAQALLAALGETGDKDP